MSYYIETSAGGFLSGLYATEGEAQAAIKRYISQSAKRSTQQNNLRQTIANLGQSLVVVRNADSPAPDYLVNELAAEIYMRIAGDAVGTIYSKPLLLGMARSRVIGMKGEYWEITTVQRQQALAKLINGNNGPLFEDAESGSITRTKSPYSLAGIGKKDGLFKSYIQRI